MTRARVREFTEHSRNKEKGQILEVTDKDKALGTREQTPREWDDELKCHPVPGVLSQAPRRGRCPRCLIARQGRVIARESEGREATIYTCGIYSAKCSMMCSLLHVLSLSLSHWWTLFLQQFYVYRKADPKAQRIPIYPSSHITPSMVSPNVNVLLWFLTTVAINETILKCCWFASYEGVSRWHLKQVPILGNQV